MYEKFEALENSKKQVILEAAINEFSEKGYEKGNTNEIIKKAGISKGLLFHYFGNKKQLYLYLINYITQKMMAKFKEYTTDLPTDFFELLAAHASIKLRIALEMTKGYKIIYDAYVNTPYDIKDEMNIELSNAFSDQRRLFEELIDESKFKEHIKKERAIDLIFAYVRGMYDQYLDEYKQMTSEDALMHIDEVTEEILETLEILKSAIYKPEYM